ncbi:hypothetical protein [Chryseobacterium tongliaoense]|uniref:hypothetical protein n=1 Tax=Chryseobacterium tongliaoense TaxID=3240933 RepID=UPI0035113EE1
MLCFKSISNFPVKYYILFIFFISCKTALPLDTTTGITQLESCNEMVYDPKYDNRGEDLAATSEFITRQYFDTGTIYSNEYGIYDPVDIRFLTNNEINTEIDKELTKIEAIHLIEEINGIKDFKTKKIKSLQINVI